MDSIFEDILKGFWRGIGYLLAELFFNTLCYWVGWPVCKLLTFGRYPHKRQSWHHLDQSSLDGVGCSLVGLIIITIGTLYFSGAFAP